MQGEQIDYQNAITFPAVTALLLKRASKQGCVL
jgi:hypothetical protein